MGSDGSVWAGKRRVGGAISRLATNEFDEVIFTRGLPDGVEESRQGNRWATMSTSAVAGLVVRPSTTAAFEIFNGHPIGGASLIITRLFNFNLVSTNVIEGFSLWAGVTVAKAAVTSGSFAVKSSAGFTYSGPVIAAASTTVVDPGWFPWTDAYQKGAGGVVPFGAVTARVNGDLVVPPQCSLVLHTVSSLVGQTFTQGAEWIEKIVTLG